MTAGAPYTATLFTVSTRLPIQMFLKVIDETYVQPEYVLGYSLDEPKNQLGALQMLGYNSIRRDVSHLKPCPRSLLKNHGRCANDWPYRLFFCKNPS